MPENSPISFKKIAATLAKLSLTVGAIYLIMGKVELDKVGHYFRELNILYFLIAVLCFFISKLISSYRLNAYYKSQSIIIDHVINAKLYFNAMFYNIFIPLVGGEAFKVLWIKKEYEAKVKPLIWSALLDRASGLVALIILTVVFFNAYDNGYEWSSWTWLIIPLSIIIAWGVHTLFFKKYLSAFTQTTLLSLLVQVLQVATIYMILLAFSIDQQIMEYIFVFLLASFAYMLPFLGARELAFIYGAEYLGLDNEISLAVSLLFYICLAINSLAGGIFFFLPIKK